MTETIINYKNSLSREMYWPFKQQKQQKIFGATLGFLGSFLMMLNPSIPYVVEMVSGSYIGLFIAMIGLIYLLEAIL